MKFKTSSHVYKPNVKISAMSTGFENFIALGTLVSDRCFSQYVMEIMLCAVCVICTHTIQIS